MRVFLVIALAFTSQVSRAQLQWGVKGGIVLTDVYVPSRFYPEYSFTPSLKYNLGGVLQWKVTEGFRLATEFQMIHRGRANNRVTYDFTYIDFLGMLNYCPHKTIALEGGMSVSYLVSATAKGGGSWSDVTNGCNMLDYAINVGFRVNAKESLSFYSRYYHGLASVDEVLAGSGNYTVVSREYNRCIEVGLMRFLH